MSHDDKVERHRANLLSGSLWREFRDNRNGLRADEERDLFVELVSSLLLSDEVCTIHSAERSTIDLTARVTPEFAEQAIAELQEAKRQAVASSARPHINRTYMGGADRSTLMFEDLDAGKSYTLDEINAMLAMPALSAIREQEQCSYCKEWYPKPVSLHHTTEECHANEAAPSCEKCAKRSEYCNFCWPRPTEGAAK